MKPLGLYFHIPFCPYRCHYCDFLSFAKHEEEISEYVKALVSDLKFFSESCRDYEIRTIFLGGGTPSLLSAQQIEAILSAVQTFFHTSCALEITVESNPGTITFEKLSSYLSLGVNRLSFGVQALQNHHLKRMGRIHTAEEAEQGFNLARKAGFQNINTDLIFGLPNQTLEEWENTLGQVLQWAPEHISMYGLQIEEGTPFSTDHKQGILTLPGEEIEASMYEKGIEFLREQGYDQYEISNFAKPGFECRHNLIYWMNEEYLGIGLGAVSYLNKKRFWMTRNLLKYLKGEERAIGEEVLPVEKEMGETMMLGLRLLQGVSNLSFFNRFGKKIQDVYKKQISKYSPSGLLEWKNENLCLSLSGMMIANEIIQDFIII
ncbi:MAG: radical SAM family heme chaperone HemW [Firmicutes bacterium]|nr:radical SAM family heme chaperone HemW [Bacillota bacterium]